MWQALPTGGLVHTLWAGLKLAAVGILFHPWGWRVAATLGITRAGDSEAGQGYHMRKMGTGQAAAALRLLPKWRDVNLDRAEVALALMADLVSYAEATWADSPLVLPANVLAADWEESDQPIYLRLPMLARDEASRDRIVATLQAHGIGAGKMYGRSLPERYPQLGIAPQAFPGAVAVARRLLTLPTHHYMTGAEQRLTVALIRSQL
jgi:dTDP-4-amino-4,6-dideoxygalactose transaminase